MSVRQNLKAKFERKRPLTCIKMPENDILFSIKSGIKNFVTKKKTNNELSICCLFVQFRFVKTCCSAFDNVF